MISLSKYLANAGYASRRKATELIELGKVRVNGRVVKIPGHKLKEGDQITVGGKNVTAENKIYILLNKPADVITTTHDEHGRTTVLDLLGKRKERLFSVGRLDYDSTGLLLMTNDGALTQKLSHPSYEVKKTYQAILDLPLKFEDLQKIRNGLILKDGPIKVDRIVYGSSKSRKQVIVALHSGKNRIVRRIFKQLGYNVTQLDRIGYAGLSKRGLRVGGWRYLTTAEVKRLSDM